VVAWWNASGRPFFDKQVPVAVVAIGGLLIALWGHVVWILRGRQAIGERRLRFLPDVVETASPGAVPGTAPGTTPGMPLLVAGAGLRRYHHPSCPLAAGRDWDAATEAEHASAGRRPCGVCIPAHIANDSGAA
jgi:hypothetical protein